MGGSELININTATEKELTRLPRVGPSTAKNIIRYREKNGEFKRKTDLMNVPRIGDKTYSNIKNLITVESSRRNYKKSRTKKSGIKKPSAKRRASTKSGNKININTASAGKLSKLPRISAKTADRIIQYRNKHGKFKTIKDLKEVRGIGIATFNNIRNMITVE